MKHFPAPNKDVLKAFVIYTNQMERLHMNMNIIDQTIKEGKENGDPLAAGQFSAINYVLQELAPKNFIPNPQTLRTEIDSHESLKWIRHLHKMVMLPIFERPDKHLEHPTIKKQEIANYRTQQKSLGKRQMPSPQSIRQKLHQALLDVAKLNQTIMPKLDIPHGLSKMDVQNMVNQAYQFNLHISCIKPFEDGSNRIARLAENAIRLNWGLPWKIISLTEKDKYLNDIFQMQDTIYKMPNL